MWTITCFNEHSTRSSSIVPGSDRATGTSVDPSDRVQLIEVVNNGILRQANYGANYSYTARNAIDVATRHTSLTMQNDATRSTFLSVALAFRERIESDRNLERIRDCPASGR